MVSTPQNRQIFIQSVIYFYKYNKISLGIILLIWRGAAVVFGATVGPWAIQPLVLINHTMSGISFLSWHGYCWGLVSGRA